MKQLTQKRLKELLHYDSDTGVFTWKKANSNRVKKGDIAGCYSRGYIVIRVDDTLHRAQRLAFLYHYGYLPEHDTDHINRIKDDNRIDNLREVSRQCNMRNCGPQSHNKSGVSGVDFQNRRKIWRARAKVSGREVFLGEHKTMRSAVMARWKAECEYGYPTCSTTSSAYQYLIKHNIIKQEQDHATI